MAEIGPMSDIDRNEIERRLHYVFVDNYLLIRALTRKSYAMEKRQRGEDCNDQEVFRTLGDAVLKTVLVDMLVHSGFRTREEITNKKAELERQETLAQIGSAIDIAEFIRMGEGEKKQKAEQQPKVIAETLEALIAAIYLDDGFSRAKIAITDWYKEHIL